MASMVKQIARKDLGRERMEFKRLTSALKAALQRWCKASKVYAPRYRALSPEAIMVMHAGLEEIQVLKPGMWDWWWANHHMRFNLKVTQRELLIVHEIMYHFLTDLARDRIQIVAADDDLDGKESKATKKRRRIGEIEEHAGA